MQWYMESKKDFVINDNKIHFYSYGNNLAFTEKRYRTKKEQINYRSKVLDKINSREE